jgi:outer membrane usher protein FimD/PapC
MQREGALKYSLAAGKYRDVDNGEEPEFSQATAIYGLPFGITAYGGLQGASMYRAGLVGIGADLRDFGSLSMDLTARTRLTTNARMRMAIVARAVRKRFSVNQYHGHAGQLSLFHLRVLYLSGGSRSA